MNCPYCNFKFKVLQFKSKQVPNLTPIICEDCAEVSLLEYGKIRKISYDELNELKRSESWNDIKLMKEIILQSKNIDGMHRKKTYDHN
jgi:Ni,Fe-hydrogenase maturation factor